MALVPLAVLGKHLIASLQLAGGIVGQCEDHVVPLGIAEVNDDCWQVFGHRDAAFHARATGFLPGSLKISSRASQSSSVGFAANLRVACAGCSPEGTTS